MGELPKVIIAFFCNCPNCIFVYCARSMVRRRKMKILSSSVIRAEARSAMQFKDSVWAGPPSSRLPFSIILINVFLLIRAKFRFFDLCQWIASNVPQLWRMLRRFTSTSHFFGFVPQSRKTYSKIMNTLLSESFPLHIDEPKRQSKQKRDKSMMLHRMKLNRGRNDVGARHDFLEQLWTSECECECEC